MKAAILAGGLGTRLRNVVSDKPKPMALLDGRPFLEYLLKWLRQYKVEEVVLCVGHQWEVIRDFFGDGGNIGMRITYSVESAPLGTWGALKKARKCFETTFLVLNGDSYFRTDLQVLINFHKDRNALATLALAHTAETKSYGSVDLCADGRIIRFREKQGVGDNEGWINAGIYVFEPEIFSFSPRDTDVSLEKDIFPHLAHQGSMIFGCQAEGYFIDIGTPERYLKAQSEIGEISIDH
jgi:D-glycero-alpha-D-manno-heptose 1-phosphate guanylyltransferase